MLPILDTELRLTMVDCGTAALKDITAKASAAHSFPVDNASTLQVDS